MDGLSAAASLIAVIQAIQMVISLCAPYLTSTNTTKHEIRRLQVELQTLNTIFEGAQRLLKSSVGARLDTSQALNNTLHDCLYKPRCPKQTFNEYSTTSKWPLASKDVDATIQTLSKFRDGLCVCLNVDQMSLLLSNYERTENIEQMKLLDRISTVPYETHHRTIREARVCNTCEWILRDSRFREWEETDSSSVLWLQGSLGTGKTFVTSKVIDHVKEAIGSSSNREGFAYFYFNQHEDERKEPVYAVRSWVRQLAALSRSPLKERGLQRGNGKACRDPELSFDEWKIFLLDLVDSYPRTTLILDALDECDKNYRSQLLEVIKILLSRSKTPLKLFISSRSDGDFKESFQSHLGIVIHAGNNQEDIRIFIHKAITAHRRWGKMSVDLREHILQVLTTRSNGMFQWAYLQIMQLLGLLTEAAILDRLGKLPLNLRATYDEMYTQIAARNPYDKALADRALMWVMCAPRYLTSTELLSAIRLPSDDGEFYMAEEIDDDLLLDLCSDLLIFDAHQKVWKFPHASVLEYLEEHRYSILQAHCHVAKACLGLLIGNYKEMGGEFINELQIMRHHEAMAIDIFDPKHPLQQYCRSNWVYHIHTQQGLRPDPGLSNLLIEFIGTPMESSAYFRSWFQATYHDRRFWPSCSISCLTMRSLKSQISPCSVGLFAACRFSLIGFMDGWLDDGTIPLGLTNCLGDNVITLATLSGCVTTCETLLHRGFPIDSGFKRHISPVDPSHARRSSIDSIDIVTSQEQDELARWSIGCYGSPLIAASVHGNMDVARLLLDNGADVDFNRGPLGSALAAASELSNIDMVKMLLKNRASINLKNEDSGSALAAAASMGRIEVVQLLLEEGANVDLQAGYYGTALAAAALHRHQDVISLLIQRGADVNLQICAGEFSNALDAAAASGSTMIIKHLLRHGAAPSRNNW